MKYNWTKTCLKSQASHSSETGVNTHPVNVNWLHEDGAIIIIIMTGASTKHSIKNITYGSI